MTEQKCKSADTCLACASNCCAPDEYTPMVLQVNIVDNAWQLNLNPDSNDRVHHVMAGDIIGEYVTPREYTRAREDYEREREASHRMVGMIVEINRRNGKALAALEAVEWVSKVDEYGDEYGECPWCGAVEGSMGGAHFDNCPRQAALAKARGEGVSDD